MAKMNEETGGEFNKHLFCLSGASGGSVGNAAYFNLLRAKSIEFTFRADENLNNLKLSMEKRRNFFSSLKKA
jgi:hypothetical protein